MDDKELRERLSDLHRRMEKVQDNTDTGAFRTFVVWALIILWFREML